MVAIGRAAAMAAFILICVLPSFAARCETDPRAVDHLASEVLKPMRGAARLAVQPLAMGRSGLPAELADRLDSLILSAMRRQAPSNITVITRADLAAACAEAVEFANRRVQDLLADARADVLITGDATARSDGLELSLRAVSIGKGKVGRVLSAPKPVLLDLADLDLATLRFQQAIWRTADAIALAASTKGGGKALDVVAAAGGGAFKEHVRDLARNRMQDLLQRQYREVAVPLNAPAPEREVLHLDLEALDQGDAVAVTLKLAGAGIAETEPHAWKWTLFPRTSFP